MTSSVRVVVSGRVQGVWYRAWTAQTAKSLGLAGWVRNRRDGSVEAVLSGEAGAVEAMVAALWEGPPLAEVAKVDRFEHDEPLAAAFVVKPTT